MRKMLEKQTQLSTFFAPNEGIKFVFYFIFLLKNVVYVFHIMLIHFDF